MSLRRQMLPFSSKRPALVWLREQGFTLLRAPANPTSGGWTNGEQQARWVSLPDQKPAGVLMISVRGEDRG